MTTTPQIRDAGLSNSFVWEPQPCPRIETAHRRIVTDLPAPQTLPQLRALARVFPQVNCYQPPVLWERAEGYQVWDAAGNCWIDFSSGAVFANTGHAHPLVRQAVQEYVAGGGLLGQFNFASEIRLRLAERLLELTPARFEKVYFWTVGSESIECALRLSRLWGMRDHADRWHVVAHTRGFHGWTLAAHQLSGDSAVKPWLLKPDAGIHHVPLPWDVLAGRRSDDEPAPPTTEAQQRAERMSESEWDEFVREQFQRLPVPPEAVAAVFMETAQGWGALPLPTGYVRALRRWADCTGTLLVFDEMQTGFGRTGRWWGFEHYGVEPDLVCAGKGLTSGLPLAALLGPAEVLDLLPPGEITTTHAAHPVSCAAALANIQALLEQSLPQQAARKGDVASDELRKLQEQFPDHVAAVTGWGLHRAVHVRNPKAGQPDRRLAREWTWAAVRHGVLLFFLNFPTIKVCPPLVIPDDALREGIAALGEALAALSES